jgi:S-DNA-T family DNA segregation ATPase FtsK/SpoIIIE
VAHQTPGDNSDQSKTKSSGERTSVNKADAPVSSTSTSSPSANAIPAANKPTAPKADETKTSALKANAPNVPTSNAPSANAQSKFANAERYTVKPEFWDSILDLIPPWGDEIAAVLLIVFGIVSLLSLFNVSSDATISAAWSNALTGLFGWGSAIVCIGIFALGVIILLPKLGVVIRFPTRRILALEFMFLSLLALLHLSAGDAELRALARVGRGGGQIGWMLTAPTINLFGIALTAAIFALILVISFAVVIGIRRDQVSEWLQTNVNALRDFGKRKRPQRAPQPSKTFMRMGKLDEALTTKPEVVVEDSSGALLVQTQSGVNAQRVRAHSIVRIRPNLENIPPSLRNAPPPSETPSMEVSSSKSSPKETVSVKTTAPASEPAPDLTQYPFFSKRETIGAEAIGTITGKRGKGEQLTAERPDGRTKRYFTVESMKESKYISKRDANLPPLDLLRDIDITLPDETEINNNVVLIENTLLEFDIDVDVVDVKVGPTVTQFALQPFKEATSTEGETTFNRTRVNKIASLSNDLALALSAKRLRLETPVPGQTYIGIEVPNKKSSVVALRSVYESRAYYDMAQKNKSPLFIPLGRDVSGAPVGADLAAMPHLLIAGTTGSGKSVAIAAMATALVLDNAPDMVKIIMLDPKMVELSRFNGLPHLLGPVETDAERIIEVLRWCTREMDRRYKVLEEVAARNLDAYNARLGRRRKDEYMPYIVILVDEIGDLMMSHPEETEQSVIRLAQKARAVGMHLVVATQRPSVDVITGLIKANFPSRMSFAVASNVDSRVILDANGAETLLGKGDMLFSPAEAMSPRRLQGCFVSDDEVRSVVQWWRDWHKAKIAEGKSEAAITGPWERGLTRREFLSETDPMLEQAISLVIAEGEASASLIQRRLGLGYPRAARIMDLLEELGIVGELKAGGRSREVLIKPGKDPFKDVIEKRMKNKN